MNENLEHKIQMAIGIYVLSCFAAMLFYGRVMLVICLIGLAIISAILNAIRNRRAASDSNQAMGNLGGTLCP